MDKVSEAVKSIQEGVQQVFTSDKYMDFLKFMAQFHHYSYRNTMLIYAQKPDATYVAGFKAWKNMGYSVLKGEKGIGIFAPMLVKEKHEHVRKDEFDDIVLDDKGKPELMEAETKRLHFRLVNVFDISQTNAEPPTLVSELKGEDAKADCLMEAIKEISQFRICFANETTDEYLAIKKNAKGYCNSYMQQIVVRDDMSGIQTTKTLLHEYAHSYFHSENFDRENNDSDRSLREIEAESTAYILATYFGIDTSEYSMPYIASWSHEKTEVLENVLNNIQEKAHGLIDILEPVYNQKVQEYVLQNQELEAVTDRNTEYER
ncbi:MAG: hypothetical protein J1F01_00740 [Oscillospiraceae bacterium]|nr:hypothetical protein [Oscillospiraceae bacterium]